MVFLFRFVFTVLLLCQVFGFAFRIGAERFKRSKPFQATAKDQSQAFFHILKNPLLNKGTSFTHIERQDLHLEGLVPCGEPLSLDLKVELAMNQLRLKVNPLEKYIYLHTIQDSDETLFYAILGKYTAETMPLVYTPTVGQACQEWSHIHKQTPRGIYLGLHHLGKVHQVLSHYPLSHDIKVIVFTDGERILGLGDLGSNGMAIPIGKLALYTTCAGIHPSQCLPVMIDVGTNTESILSDPYYVGTRSPRHRGPAYDQLIKEFISASQQLYGREVLLQFEDFGNSNAFRLLDEYKDKATCFNDDIQGTASVVVAGLKASLRLVNMKQHTNGGPPIQLKDQRYLFYGAGEAGIGIADLLSAAMVSEEISTFTPQQKSTFDSAPLEMKSRLLDEYRKQCWFVDSQGLITSDRLLETVAGSPDLGTGGKTVEPGTGQNTKVKPPRRPLEEHKIPYAHNLQTLGETAEKIHQISSSLSSSMDMVKPSVLIGVSAQGGAFTTEILQQMKRYSSLPQVFALSNPTSKAECTAREAYEALDGQVIFASGSPFDPVTLINPTGDTTIKVPGQGNNAYIFPGLGLGALVAKALTITDEDFLIAADTLASLVSEERLALGCVYPALEDIRSVSQVIAAQVAQHIVTTGRSSLYSKEEGVTVDWMKKCEESMYSPQY
jgi:malate dehydrogenase (oxaloacetate-decarboxylating)(NADP+)